MILHKVYHHCFLLHEYIPTYAGKEVIHGQQAPDIRYIESPQPANHLVPVATDVVHTHTHMLPTWGGGVIFLIKPIFL